MDAGRFEAVTELSKRYFREGEPALLEQAIAGFVELLAESDDPSDRAVVLIEYSKTLAARAWRLGRPEDADAALEAARAAVELTAADSPDRPARLTTTASAHLSRWETTAAETDFEEAVSSYRMALALDPEYQWALSGLGVALARRRTQGGGVPSDTLEAEQLCARALAQSSVEADRPELLTDLAFVLFARANENMDATPLDESIRMLDEARTLAPAGSMDWFRSSATAALAHFARAALLERAADMRAARDRMRRTLEEMPADLPNRPLLQGMLGAAWAIEYQNSGDRADRDRAIDLLSETLTTLVPGRGPGWSQTSGILRKVLGGRLDDDRTLADADRMITLLATALTLAPADADLAAELAAVRGIKFGIVGDPELLGVDQNSPGVTPMQLAMSTVAAVLLAPEVLDDRIAAVESLLATLPPADPDRFVLVNALAVGHLGVFAQRGDDTALNRAIEVAQAAVDRLDAGDRQRATLLSTLSRALIQRFGIREDDQDLLRGAESAAAATRAVAAEHPDRANLDDALASALLIRFGRFGDPADLAEAIAAFQSAVDATPAEYPLRLTYRAGLGRALEQRYILYGEQADHRSALEIAEQAQSAMAAGGADRVTHLHALSSTLTHEFVRTGDLRTLDRAERMLRQALDLAPAFRRPGIQSDLGHIFKLRSQRRGSGEDLDAAIAMCAEALAAAEPGSNARTRFAVALADALRVRSERTSSVEDADRAVATLRAVSSSRPSVRELCLASALHQRFALTGASADIDESVVICRTALAGTIEGTTLWLDLQRMLSGILWARYRGLDDVNDLDAALTALDPVRDARTIRLDAASSYGDLYNRAGMLLDRFDLTRTSADLDDAIAANEGAAQRIPAGHPHPSIIANGLALLYGRRYDATNQRSDLDASVEYGTAALASTPRGDGLRASREHVYGHGRWAKYQITGSWWDLRAARKAFEAAVSATPSWHPAFGARAHSLGELLVARHAKGGRRRDRDNALAILRQAVDADATATATRVASARTLGAFQSALGRPVEALETYRRCIQELLPVLTWRGLDRASQENQLETTAGLACEAAAVALTCGSPGAAVQLLEQGRGVLWSQLLQTRSDRDELRELAPGLAAEFDQICAALDGPEDATIGRFQPTVDGGPIPAIDDRGAARRRAATRFAELRDEIRTQPGLEHFLAPPDLADLRHAVDGPVAIINVDAHRCDAIIVTPEQLRVVALPALTEASARRHSALLHRSLSALSNDPGSRIAATQTLYATLEWLWTTVTFPVLAALGRIDDTVESARRIWWYPTGPLSAMPLHAAGRHRPGDSQDWVGAHAVSSYAWTLQTLRRGSGTPVGSSRTLAVGLAATPRADADYADLPAVPAEMRVVAAAFADMATILEGEAANRAAVLAALPTYDRVHFACHGRQNPAAPSASHLALHDADLTLLDVVRASPATEAESAFLSACDTARGDETLADESIHMAAAFQLAGYRHVIGTLWALRDAAPPHIARDVYARAPENSAAALHRAVLNLKRRKGFTSPLSWASFIHLGP